MDTVTGAPLNDGTRAARNWRSAHLPAAVPENGPSTISTQSSITWSTAGPPPAMFLHTSGLVSARCVNQGNIGYLAVTVNADPNDARTDQIPGDVRLGGQPAPGWGLHLVDVNIAQGDLIRVVQDQARAYQERRRRR